MFLVVFQMSEWPPQDHIPDTSKPLNIFFETNKVPNAGYLSGSPEVREWLKELDGFTIPNITPTADGSCAGDLTAAGQAAQRGWWTCGGYTRSTGTLLFPVPDDII